MESEPRELYILDEVIKTLNEIRINGEGELNLLKGILCLANEIKKLKQDSLGASSVVWE